MKFCQPHWDQLRQAITDAGLAHLVAKSGKDAASRIVDELRGFATDETFDPLMAAHNALTESFMKPLKGGGLYLFTGDYCPMCELDRLNPGRNLPTNWINGVTADIKRYCEEKGLSGDVFAELEEAKTDAE